VTLERIQQLREGAEYARVRWGVGERLLLNATELLELLDDAERVEVGRIHRLFREPAADMARRRRTSESWR
jgi:hypothetical protein